MAFARRDRLIVARHEVSQAISLCYATLRRFAAAEGPWSVLDELRLIVYPPIVGEGKALLGFQQLLERCVRRRGNQAMTSMVNPPGASK
jgi:hypothetical protein